MTTELTGLIPLALVIALSPLTVIPAVLVLQTPRPRATSLGFLAGWLAGLAILTAIFVTASGLLGGLHRTPPSWASWLRIVVGTALVVFGVYRWLARHNHADMPGWLRSLTELTPLRAVLTAVVLAAARPEVLFMCAAAGLSIGSAGLGVTSSWAVATLFVAVAGASVTIPVLGYVIASNRLGPALARLKDWLAQQHAALLAIVLVVIGALVVYHGIDALQLR
ncbi:MAG: GAP family protein [Mycobacterium sp.]